jgi:hypothetical protein
MKNSAKSKGAMTMKRTILKALALAALFCVLMATVSRAQQAPIPITPAQVPGPVPGTAMTTAYVQTVGHLAYVWGWPLVNAANRAKTFAKAPEPGLMGGVVPVAFNRIAMLTGYVDPAQRFIACPNQDVVYGTGFFDLDKEPIVFQVPDFGERFWVYALYDARTDEFSKIGKQYGTKPGFYLVVGPKWKGEKPADVVAVVRSSTRMAFGIPRIFLDDTPEDHKAIQSVISQINFYPLSEFDGKMKTTDWSKLPHFPAAKSKGETQWVNPETFFDELPAVMKQVPPAAGRGSALRLDRQRAGGRRQGPGDQKDPQGNGRRGGARDDYAVPSVALQRPSCWQRLELAGERCAVGHRLPQSHGHRQVEHV